MNEILMQGFVERVNQEMIKGGQEKRAIVGHFIASLAGLHGGVNAGMKAVKTTGLGKKLLQSTFNAGYDVGKHRKQMNPIFTNSAKYGIGPESIVEHQLGQLTGRMARVAEKARTPAQKKRLGRMATSYMSKQKAIQNLPKAQRAGVAKAVVDVATNPKDTARIIKDIPQEIKNAPIMHSLLGNKDHDLRGVTEIMKKAPWKLHEKSKGTKSKIISGALGAGAVAVNPHAGIQIGLSALRDRISQTGFGKNILQKGFEKGLQGKMPGKIRQWASDLVVSPAVLDPQRIGKSIHRASKNPENIRKGMKAWLSRTD